MTVDLLSSSQLAKTQGNVFATDAILATLMCCTRSVNSWDIIVQRVGNKLFFDKRDNSDFGESPDCWGAIVNRNCPQMVDLNYSLSVLCL